MKKINFNDKFGLTQAVLEGRKTMTRRIVPDGTPLGNWAETESKSRYKVGEIVAVAQCYEEALSPLDWVNRLIYKDEPGWNNKMFVLADLMPHHIRITSFRTERLQDISDQDCMNEGVVKTPQGFYSFEGWGGKTTQWYAMTPRGAFAALIDKISGKGTWKSNPYVFVYKFELVK